MKSIPDASVRQRKRQGMILLQGGRVAEAKAIFEALSRDARRDPDVWHLLGACNCMLGDNARGEECARKAVALMPSFAGTWVNLGSALLVQHKLAEAESALHEAIKREPANAQAHNNLGNVYREMKKTDAAEKCYHEALRLRPNFLDALTNLGLVMQDSGELREAVALHRRALALNPRHVDAHYNLGYALILLDDAKSAISHLEVVTQMRPGDTRGWISLGGAYARVHNHKRSMQCYERGVSLDPDNFENVAALGASFLAAGERDKSVAALKRALELKPSDADTRYWLAAAGVGEAPETMSPGAVAKLFDGYAGNFDEHLVGKLQYSTPTLLNNALRRALGDEACALSLLDIGCGTGLLGKEVKDIAGYLAGVDLSPKMIERARTRGIYDDLTVQDITKFMETATRNFDAVLSADVFVYLGDLDRVFSATSACLVAGGLFAFSVEAHIGDEPYHLRTSGRYAHSMHYLRELSGRYGYTALGAETVILRMENGVPMEGYIMVLRRE
jgi:predicted TPR repeat methyltransferase